MSKMNRGGGGVNLLLYVSVESCPKPFQTNTKNFNFGGVLRIQSLPPLIQVNHSKYLYQWNPGDGTMYILFRHQRTTDEMLQNVYEVNKERSLIAAVSRVCVTRPNNGLVTLFPNFL